MGIKKDFGLRIKEIRNKKGITQARLAEKVNIDSKHMSHIETGRSFPKADLIEKFASALDIDYQEFFLTKHLADREELILQINNRLKTVDDRELRCVYKFLLYS